MNIKVMSRREAIMHSYKQEIPKCIIISINCLNDHSPTFYECTNPEYKRVMAVLRLNFNDIDRPYEDLEPKQGDFVGLKAFIDTFKDNSDIEDIIIHCAAGISRSSATAAAICRYLNLDEMNIIWKNTSYVPNKLVYKLALRELGIIVSDEEIENLKAINKEERDKQEVPIDLERMFKDIGLS